MAFAAGQFTMLHAFGAGEAPISISGDPARPDLLEHTIRDVGAVTHALVHATPGTELGVRGPFGTGWDVSSGRGGDVVFVAGGIGLAPLRPAVLELCEARADYGRVVLLYGARTPEDILFGDDLRALGGRVRHRRAGHRRQRPARLARPRRPGDPARRPRRLRRVEHPGAGLRPRGDDAVRRVGARRARRARRRACACRWSAT